MPEREGGPSARPTLAVGRYLDVLLVAVATPVVLVLGAPVLGCVIGAVAWLGQRLLAQLDRRWIEGTAELRAGSAST